MHKSRGGLTHVPIFSDKFAHLTKRSHIFIICELNQAGDGEWRTVKVAGDEQDDNSKVGKIIIYHINFDEEQGIKNNIFLFFVFYLQ